MHGVDCMNRVVGDMVALVGLLCSVLFCLSLCVVVLTVVCLTDWPMRVAERAMKDMAIGEV